MTDDAILNDLRRSLRLYLAEEEMTVYALAKGFRWSPSDYVALSRFASGRKDERTGRRFGLPVRLRVTVAALIGYPGAVTPSPHPSPVGSLERARTKMIREKKKKQ